MKNYKGTLLLFALTALFALVNYFSPFIYTLAACFGSGMFAFIYYWIELDEYEEKKRIQLFKKKYPNVGMSHYEYFKDIGRV